MYERSLDFLLAERRRLVAAMHSSEQLAWVAVTSSQWENLERDLRAQLTASAASDVLSGATVPVAGGVASADPLPAAAAATAAAAAAKKNATKGKRATSARRGKKKDAGAADGDASAAGAAGDTQARSAKRVKAEPGTPVPGSAAGTPTPQPETLRSPGPPPSGGHAVGLSSPLSSMPHAQAARPRQPSAAAPGTAPHAVAAAAAHAASIAAGSSSSSSADAVMAGQGYGQHTLPHTAQPPYMASAGAPSHAHHGARTELEGGLAHPENGVTAAMAPGPATHLHAAPEPAAAPAMPPVAQPMPSGHAAILAMHGVAPGQVHATVLQLIHAADVAYSNVHAAKLAGREDEAAEHEAQRQQMATHIAMAAQQARQAQTLRAFQMQQAAASAGAPPAAWTGASAP